MRRIARREDDGTDRQWSARLTERRVIHQLRPTCAAIKRTPEPALRGAEVDDVRDWSGWIAMAVARPVRDRRDSRSGHSAAPARSRPKSRRARPRPRALPCQMPEHSSGQSPAGVRSKPDNFRSRIRRVIPRSRLRELRRVWFRQVLTQRAERRLNNKLLAATPASRVVMNRVVRDEEKFHRFQFESGRNIFCA